MATLKLYNPIVTDEQRSEMNFFGLDGVSFQSIDDFVATIPEADDTIDLRIHCPGGVVSEGWAMVDKLRATGKTIIATIEGQCASMATVLLLAASVRKGAKHASLLIHNPYFPEYSLEGAYRAEDLERLAGDLRRDTAQLLDFYAERTGADRAVLEALMKEGLSINMARAKELGFIHDIIEPASASVQKQSAAGAWRQHITNNQKSNSMSEKRSNKSAIAKALALVAEALGVGTSRSVSYELNTSTGDVITIDKPEGDDPAIGDAASPDGEHQMPDGSAIVILDGIITEIRDVEGDDSDGDGELASAQTRIAELEQECAGLRKSAKSDTEKRILNLVAIAGGEAWLAKARSEYNPQGRASTAGAHAASNKGDAKQSRVQQQLDALRQRNAARE